ncbi:MAG: hypothetical protein HKN36_07175 [Hellea sp.]|nr:hypothetical protein [Hellea sp.]
MNGSRYKNRKIVFGMAFITAAMFSACSTVKVSDVVKLPEFRDAATEAGSFTYPDPAEAPAVPTDLRSAREWDQAAKLIIKRAATVDVPEDPYANISDAEIAREIQALKNKVKEYKLDDPVE